MDKENEDANNNDYLNISDDDNDKDANTNKDKDKAKDDTIIQSNTGGNIFETIFNEIKESMIQTEHSQIKKELNDEGFCIVENNVVSHQNEDNWEIISTLKK